MSLYTTRKITGASGLHVYVAFLLIHVTTPIKRINIKHCIDTFRSNYVFFPYHVMITSHKHCWREVWILSWSILTNIMYLKNNQRNDVILSKKRNNEWHQFKAWWVNIWHWCKKYKIQSNMLILIVEKMIHEKQELSL